MTHIKEDLYVYGPGEFGPPDSVSIVGGILTLTSGGSYVVSAEAGVADDIDQIAGLSIGDEVTISPASGHTIVVKDGASLQIRANFTMDGEYDNMKLLCVADGICRQSARNAN